VGERGGGVGPRGEWAGEEMGRRWKKKKKEERWAAGLGREDGLFVFSFFQILFKSFSNLFKSNLFTKFSNFFTNIFKTFLKLF
jgi:succinate dehydrogenase/fumarate reductase cytochrome b subunit